MYVRPSILTLVLQPDSALTHCTNGYPPQAPPLPLQDLIRTPEQHNTTEDVGAALARLSPLGAVRKVLALFHAATEPVPTNLSAGLFGVRVRCGCGGGDIDRCGCGPRRDALNRHR